MGSIDRGMAGGINEVFQRTDSAGAANFLTDALGSTLVLTDSSGSTLASYEYEPFGNTTVTSGSSASTYEYTGQVNDGTGLYFYRARYYSPTLQRFISEDPAFPAGGINAYAYASNNPMFWADPFGLNPTPVTPWDRLRLVGVTCPPAPHASYYDIRVVEPLPFSVTTETRDVGRL